MSFLPINEQNQLGPQGQTTPNPQGQPPPQSGGSAGAGSGGAKGSAVGTPTQFGSSASKLGDYLSANAPQIGQQAQNVAGQLNQQYGQVQGDITNAANQFNQSVAGGYAAPNQDIVNQALSNPTQFAQTPENVSAFQAQYNNQYTGPQNFESTSPYANIQGEVQQAVNQGNLLGSQAGLQSYLQGKGNNPTRASSTLDSLLLSGNPEANQTIKTAAGQFNNLTGQLDTARSAGNQKVSEAKTAADQSRQAAQDASNQYVQNFGTQLNQNVQTTQDAINNYNNTANQNISNIGAIKPFLDPTVNAFQQYGLNIPDYLKPYTQPLPQVNQTIATLSNTATPEQYAQAQALQKLLGNNYQSPLDQTNVGQAGTAKAGQIESIKSPNVGNLEAHTLGDFMNQIYQQQFGNHPERVNTQSYNTALNNPLNESMEYGGGTYRQNLDAYLKSIAGLNPDLIKPGQPGTPPGMYYINERGIPELA